MQINNFQSTKKQKFKKLLLILKKVSKAAHKMFLLCQTQEKFVLKIGLSIRVRNFAPLNESLNIKKMLAPKSPTQRDFIV
jgi:hypothetical protein